MRKLWISLLVASLLFTSLVSSAPTKTDEASKKNTADKNTDKSTNTLESKDTNKATTKSKQDSQNTGNEEFNVPSAKLDNGNLLNAVSSSQKLTSSKKSDAASIELKKPSSKKDKETEAKLLKMVFDGKDKKFTLSDTENKENAETKQGSALKKNKKKHHAKNKGKAKSRFTVFNLDDDKKRMNDKSNQLHHRKHKRKAFEKSQDKLSWKRPEYSDDSEYGEERSKHHRRHNARRDHIHRKRLHDRRGRNARKLPDDEDRKWSYSHSEPIQVKVNPSDLGFDQERMAAIFGSAYRPDGFGPRSMDYLTQSRKMFSHGFHDNY